MNEYDLCEKHLRSWTPRRPSADIAARIFNQQPATEVAAPIWHGLELSRWLAPVAACFLTLLVVLNGSFLASSPSAGIAGESFFAEVAFGGTSISSDPSQRFVLSKADENLEWNIWPHATFKTTNRSSSFVPACFFAASLTNR